MKHPMVPKTQAAASSVWENPVKRLLREGRPAIGITITTNSVEAAAQAADLGFDFLWLEMEHSPITLETLRQIILATRGLKAVPLARVPFNELWLAKRVLDAGALGVVFPFTSTPALARQAVEACRYPPVGRRGSGAKLATFRWPAPEGYYDFADRNILVVTVIEDAQGLREIDRIAATPNVDVIFIGTGDLSFSLGLRGEQNHPKLEKVVSKIVSAAQRHGKTLGRVVQTADQLKQSIDQGFLFFQVPTELHFMAEGAGQFLAAVGRKKGPDTNRAFY